MSRRSVGIIRVGIAIGLVAAQLASGLTSQVGAAGANVRTATAPAKAKCCGRGGDCCGRACCASPKTPRPDDPSAPASPQSAELRTSEGVKALFWLPPDPSVRDDRRFPRAPDDVARPVRGSPVHQHVRLQI